MYKTLRKTILVCLLLWLGIFLYALWVWYPNSLPDGGVQTWKIGTYIQNIIDSCASDEYAQWFDQTGKIICKKTNIFQTLSIWSHTSYMVWWSWTYIKYLGKILNDCWSGYLVVWFDANKNMVCKSNQNTTKLVWMGISMSNDFTSIVLPSWIPWWEVWWGLYSQQFNKVFQTCWTNEYLRGYDAGWNIVCGSIIHWKCGTAKGVSTYSPPVTWLCESWTPSWVVNNPWNFTWTCGWNAMWWSDSCSAPKKIDGWWSSWSGWSACSLSCGWWVQNRTRVCNNPLPQNGGNNCVWSPIETQSCNTQSCCDTNVWKTCIIWSNTCPPWMTFKNDNNCRSEVRGPDTFGNAYDYCKNNFWTTYLGNPYFWTESWYYPVWRRFTEAENQINYQCPRGSQSCYPSGSYPHVDLNSRCYVDAPNPTSINVVFSDLHTRNECPWVYNGKAYYYCGILKKSGTIQCDWTCK